MSQSEQVKAKVATLVALERAATPGPWGVNKYMAIGSGVRFTERFVVGADGLIRALAAVIRSTK